MKHITRSLAALVLLFTFTLASAQWTRLPDIAGMDIHKLSFPTDLVGYALGNYSFTGYADLLRTDDGAQTWDTLPLPFPDGTEIQNVHFTAADTGFIAWRRFSGPNAGMRLSKTWDGGQSWTDISPDTANLGSGISGLHFSNAHIGHFGVADKFYSTTDGGATWTVASATMYSMVNDIDFADPDHGMIGMQDGTFGYRGLIYSTANGGTTWDSLYFPAWNSSVAKIRTDQPNIGFGIRNLFDQAVFLRTSNNWATWDSIELAMLDSNMYEGPRGLDFIGQQGWICTSSGRILRSTDSGTNWTEERAPDSIQIEDLVIAPTKVYAGGNFGRVFVRDLMLSTQPQAPTAGIIAYPNPLQRGSTLHVQGSESDQILECINLQGQVIATLRLNPGINTLHLPETAAGLLMLRRNDGITTKILITE
ncbi:MAG: hypothetical protein U0176_11890 [Bacteroidia bacterium]